MSSGGPKPVCLGRASVCELPIERRGEQPRSEADPPSIRRGRQSAGVVRIREEQEWGPVGPILLSEPRGPPALAVMRVLAGAPVPRLSGELGCGHLSMVSGAEPGRRRSTLADHEIAVVVYDGFTPFELGVVCEVFGEDRWVAAGDPWYRLFICGENSAPVTADTGFQITVPYGLDRLAKVDTVIVAPTYRPDEVPASVYDALRRAHARGARILSLCGGAFVLAESGLLDGRRAATHWTECDDLARRYPSLSVDSSVL